LRIVTGVIKDLTIGINFLTELKVDYSKKIIVIDQPSKFYLKIFAKQTRYDSFVKLFSFTIKNVDDVCFRI
ncbi:hypothetical protein LCGC14_2198690, partial [marine sediment metagenome]